MRKRIGYIFILLAICFLSEAQSFRFGIVGGVNSSRIDNDRHDIWGKLGLNGGVFVERDLIPGVLFWEMDLKYTARGKYQGPTSTNLGISIIDLKYVEFPVGINYRINDQFSFGIGIAPDVLLSERHYDENGLLPNIDPIYGVGQNGDPDENRTFYFGLTAYAAMNYYFLENFAAEIRFNYSVFPFYKFDAYAVRYRDSGLFHDVISINLKYYI